jgi:acetyl esterase/lipase
MRWVATRLAILHAMIWASAAAGQEPSVEVVRDVEYARVGEQRLALDLYRPKGVEKPPLVVWVHGGAWRSGSRRQVPLLGLVEHGLAIASVDYRLSTVAPFPAQVHDLKAAIRYLRGTAARHGIWAERIAIAGSSAGGHLALLVGVTAGVPELEGDVGEYRQASSAVQAVVDFFGPTNLTTILAQSTPHGLSVRVPALKLLLGGLPEERMELARLASPVLHLDPHDPPLLVYHGDQDPQVPIQQSQELVEACRKAGVPIRFEVVEGGVHGGERFFTPQQIAQVKAFLDPLLAPPQAPYPSAPKGK